MSGRSDRGHYEPHVRPEHRSRGDGAGVVQRLCQVDDHRRNGCPGGCRKGQEEGQEDDSQEDHEEVRGRVKGPQGIGRFRSAQVACATTAGGCEACRSSIGSAGPRAAVGPKGHSRRTARARACAAAATTSVAAGGAAGRGGCYHATAAGTGARIPQKQETIRGWSEHCSRSRIPNAAAGLWQGLELAAAGPSGAGESAEAIRWLLPRCPAGQPETVIRETSGAGEDHCRDRGQCHGF